MDLAGEHLDFFPVGLLKVANLLVQRDLLLLSWNRWHRVDPSCLKRASARNRQRCC